MGTVSSGTGLVSGLDIESIVSQLMQLEARPRQQVEQRVSELETQKEALLDVNTSVLGVRSAADDLALPSNFSVKQATSSNENVLTAEANRSAAEGTYTFIVDRLVSSHQMISRGFADSDTTAIGEGTLSFSPEAARLSNNLQLSNLNGGEGVQRGQIAITDRSGATATVDLSRASTLDEVLSAINTSSGIGVRASLDGDRLVLSDTTGQTAQNISVAEVGGRSTAADLGILGDSGGGSTLTGAAINRISENSQLAALNDRNGIGIIGNGQNDFSVSLDGSSFDVSLHGATTLGQVIERINDHAANPGVTASIADDGVSLELTGSGTISVDALNGSSAAKDLGILGEGSGTLSGERVVAALNSRLLSNLNGGAGIGTYGSIDITNRSGTTTQVDLSAARSVSDVINTINDAGAGVTAKLNSAGNGLLLTDTTGGTQDLVIADVDDSTVAADLGLATAGHDSATLDTGSLDYRYVSEATLLKDLNGGSGVSSGQFTLVDSAGISSTVTVNENDKSLRDIIAEINSRPTSIVASINERGDGLLLTDTAGGAQQMRIEEAGSSTAADLGIRGEAAEGETTLEGSFRKTVEVELGDTLEDVAEKINDAGIFVTASVVDDGSGDNSSRLTFASRRSGVAGQMVFDDGGLNLGAATLSRGRDAVAFYGSDDPADALMVTSRNNTLNDVVPGVSIDLNAASEGPVDVTVDRNDGEVIEKINAFVEAFNGAVEKLAEYDFYDQETNERGVLLGDPTLAQVERRLYNLINGKVSGVDGQFDHLSQVGIRVGEEGVLEFDESRLKEALNTDHEAVKQLFTASEAVTPEPPDLPPGVSVPDQPRRLEPIGFARRMAQLGAELTNSVDGTITLRTQNIDSDVELNNDRIEQLNRLLQSKRQRLEQEFYAMEQALSQMQSQQNSLSKLSQIAQQSGGGLGGLAGLG